MKLDDRLVCRIINFEKEVQEFVVNRQVQREQPAKEEAGLEGERVRIAKNDSQETLEGERVGGTKDKPQERPE